MMWNPRDYLAGLPDQPLDPACLVDDLLDPGRDSRCHVHGASHISVWRVRRQARRRSALRANAEPSATPATTSTSTRTARPPTAASIAAAADLPTTSGASTAPTHERRGHVPREYLTPSLLVLHDAATGCANLPLVSHTRYTRLANTSRGSKPVGCCRAQKCRQ